VAPTQTPAAQASTGTVASTSDLLPVAAAVAAAKSYHVNVTSTTAAPGQGTTVALDVVKPDRMHAVADVGANKSFEMITIGTNTYLKAGDTWTKAPVPNAVPAPAIAGMMNDDPQKLLGLISQAQQSGTLTKGSTEQVNGTTCQDWVWTPTSAGATNSGGTLCVGSDNLPVQFKSNNGNVVATYSQWNAPISIEPPTTA
jgi:hypothetical protein